MFNNIIIGAGEIGKAIGQNVYGNICFVDLDKRDNNIPKERCVLHICFPYNDGFIKWVLEYTKEFKPLCVIIHSTVPVGTTKQIYETYKDVIYSPVRGRHKDTLVDHIKRFVKYYACKGDYEEILNYIFHHIRLKKIEDFNTLEYAKIMSTTYMYWNLIFNKYVKLDCDRKNVDFDMAYKEWNKTYNVMCDGYIYNKEFARPIYDYIDEPVGGHCLNENLELLDNEIIEIIKNAKKDLNI